MDDGASMPYRAWLPETPRAVALALHGFTESRDFFEYPAPAFTAAGIAVYAPDQRGFGAGPRRGYWAGNARMVADAVACFAFVRQTHPGLPAYLIGESMGGSVAILAQSGCQPDAMGLLAPATWSRREMGPLYRGGVWFARHVFPGFVGTARDVPNPVWASDNIAALERLSRDPLTLKEVRLDVLAGVAGLMDEAARQVGTITAPCLWLYGAHDQVVPAKATLESWRRTRQVRQAYYGHGYHLLLRDRARAVPTADLLGFLRDPAGPLVSSAEIAAAAWRAGA
jgi:alpha-beta hydrolase superfamily lysophospholipase